MGRPKKVKTELRSVEECTAAMGELLRAVTDIEALTAERDMAVAAAGQRFEAILDDARGRRDEAEAALKEYYYAHLAEIEREGRKHLQLANGVMGRRDHPPSLAVANRAWTWTAVKAAVRSLLGGEYFHAPKDPELDKDKLKTLDAEKLRACGLRLVTEETWYVEPARLPAEAAL